MIAGIVLRAIVAYVFLQFLVRASGKRTIKQGTALDLTVALVIADIVDNAVLGESQFAQFLVAATTLIGAHIILKVRRASAADAI